MAGYEKSTFSDFKERLNSGHYESIAGARRGIGKMKLSKEENERAQVLATKHFGESAPAATKAPRKVKTTKKVAKAKAAKAVKVPKAKAAAVKPAKEPRQKRGRKAAPAADQQAMDQTIRIGTIQQALKAMQDAKSLGAPTSEVAEGARKAQVALVSIVNELCPRDSMQPTAEDLRQAEALSKAAKAANANGNGSSEPVS